MRKMYLDNKAESGAINYYEPFLNHLLEKNGPDSYEYVYLTRWLDNVYEDYKSGNLSKNDWEYIQSIFTKQCDERTIQGFIYCRPHGYAGDYEVIERFYNKYITSEEKLFKWDQYIQSRPAAKAVRNRKTYFINTLEKFIRNVNKDVSVLNLASGPCRDVYEYFERKSCNESRTHFTCVDGDEKSISYAKKLCSGHLEDITFVHKNIFRFKSNEKYDLLWSAGLFDYFNDKYFIKALDSMKNMTSKGSYIIIGNFNKSNPAKSYMEILNWNLYHRSQDDLFNLAVNVGFPKQNIFVEKEPEGVNLFLKIKC